MRPHIQTIVDDLLDQVQAKGRFDIIGDLAFPLPVIVITELIGVPVEDRDQFKEWTGALARSLDPVVTQEIIAAANNATDSFVDYFTRLVAKRRAQPHEDMLSALIAVEEEGDRLNQDELIATIVLLFGAGHETTMNLIGNGMLALFRNPDQLAKLKAEPTLIQTAVEEFLRYDGSVQITARVALEDIEMGGKLIHKNQQSLILLGAANHDPAQFANPDQLDITRQDNPHITFGHGIHHCLGAPLARVEAQIAVNTLLRRMPDIKQETENVEWREMITLRGIRALPVTC
jgi:cytochrome P450